MAMSQSVLDALADAETLEANVSVRDRRRREALRVINILSFSMSRHIGRDADADYDEACSLARAAFSLCRSLRSAGLRG